MRNRYLVGIVVASIAITVLVVYFARSPEPTAPQEVPTDVPVVTEPTKEDGIVTQIGTSVEGRPINAVRFGTGDTHLLFVGGIHGGYEWNSVLLAYAFIDYLDTNPAFIPQHLSITVMPSANPDGLFAVIGKEGRISAADTPATHTNTTGTGRFNARNVDLNRNFDCKWQPESTWRSKAVSAGTAPFSEPEAAAIRDLVQQTAPKAVVFWHSQANAVYASECENGILPKTLEIMSAYASAADYAAVSVFDAYPVTGDAEGWLASIGIPAITVELETRTSVEWERNLAGISALLGVFPQP